MTSRQPKGRSTGGQFAPNVNPESSIDLALIGSADPETITRESLSESLLAAADVLESEPCKETYLHVGNTLGSARDVMSETDEYGASEWLDEMSGMAFGLSDNFTGLNKERQRAIAENLAGQIREAAEQLEVARPEDQFRPVVEEDDHEWTSAERTIAGIKYHVEREDNENDTVSYNLTDPLYKGGWKFEYDRLTRRATAQGKHPPLILDKKDMQAWRDRGEANICNVVGELEPTAVLADLDGETYYVDGRQGWALSESVKSGLNTGQMMLTGGEKVKEIGEYVRQQRRLDAEQIRNHPELEGAVAETERYLTGIELAVEMGRDAAEANTVGAAKARGLA